MNVTTEPYLSIRDVSSSYGETAVLEAINLEIRRGEFITLLGPSGSGKSTLLMVLAGFVPSSRGSIVLEGLDICSMSPNLRNFGFVFQNYALFPHMTVLANVLFPLRVRGITGQLATRRALASLERVGLAAFADRAINSLSGGQRQRVAFARAVVAEPRLLLMDEPLSALDKNLREEMQVEIRKMHDALGITTVYVTHDQREAMTMADRIAVMNRGRVEQVDVPEGVYCRPRTPFVANFMGQANVLPIELFEPDITAATAIDSARREGKSHVVARAENITLFSTGVSEPSVSITAQFERASFQGDSWMLIFEVSGGSRLRACVGMRDAAQIASLSQGSTLRLRVPVSGLWFVAHEQPATKGSTR